MMKLTQNERAVLSSACENKNGFATRPNSLSEAQATKTASSLTEKGLAKETRSKSNAPIWRIDDGGHRYALKILEAGREATKAPTAHRTAPKAVKGAPIKSASKPKSGSGAGSRPEQGKRKPTNERFPRAGSKQAMLVKILRNGGATIEALVAATDWLPHTTRAALTGLRKKGFTITRERQESSGHSFYRIESTASKAAA